MRKDKTLYRRGEPVIIIGAGGHGSEIYSYILDLLRKGENVYAAGFVDEKAGKRKSREGKGIIGDLIDLKNFLAHNKERKFLYITAFGNNALRKEFVRKIDGLKLPNLKPWSLQHPASTVGYGVKIGVGTCLAPGSIVTTKAAIGKHCIFNVNSSVSHDCLVGDFVNINPHAVICGNVTLGQGCYIGAGAVIIEKVTIGAWSVIGAGAVVTGDIPANVTAVGIPARVIKKNR